MAEAHDRCPHPLCLLGRAHVGPCSADGAPRPAPTAAPVAPTAHGPTEVEQLLVDLADAARGHDEAALHHQRSAGELRRCAAMIAAWRTKQPPPSTGVTSTGRGINP